MNLFDLPPQRFLNYIYAWYVARVQNQENLEQFNAILEAPPEGSARKVRRPTEEELAREGDDFMAFMGQMTG